MSVQQAALISRPQPSSWFKRLSSGFSPQSFYVGLGMVRYLLLQKTPRDDPIDYPLPRQHCLGMESAVTRTPLTHDNLPDVETCATSTCSTLRRSVPPSPSPSLKRIPALSTGAMPHAIATQQRFPRPGRRRPSRQDPNGRSPQRVALSAN